MNKLIIYVVLVSAVLLIGSVAALSDNDYIIRSLNNFNCHLYSSSLLFGLDSDSYNYVALEPLGLGSLPTELYRWETLSGNGETTGLFLDPDPIDYQVFPVSFGGWVKRDASQIDSYGLIVGRYYNFQLLVLNDGRVAAAFHNGVDWSNLVTTTIISENWNHLMVTFAENGADTDAVIYINGVADEYGTLNGQPDLSTTNLCIGANEQPSYTDRFKGELQSVIVYNSALTSSDAENLADNMGAIDGVNCQLWVAPEYGGRFYMMCGANSTIQIHESVDSVRVNGAPYSEGDTLKLVQGTGYSFEWAYTLAPLLPIDFLFGMVGLLGCFVLPLYMIKKLKEHDVDTAVLFCFIGLCVCIAFVVGWLWA